MAELRLIDANALYETLKNMPFGYAESFAGKAAMSEVKAAPTIDTAPRWISVEERLPEERAVVLVVRDEKLYGRTVTIGWHRCGKWELPIGAKITHWMPLPEPPKEEQAT